MQTIIITILTVLVLAILGLVLWLIKQMASDRQDSATRTTAISMLQQQLEAIRNSQQQTDKVLQENLKTGQDNISKYLQNSQQTLTGLHKQLGQLENSSRQILQLSTDVRSLQDILKNPKLRGQMGELSLEKVLGEILPVGSFNLQHSFKNGKIVDALIRLPQYSVSVDAKFPLPAFEAMVRCPNEAEKQKLRRQFQADVSRHIDKIASSYILPDEQTLDFALMYIPAENVYYETIIKYQADKTDLLSYALQKKVIPVSPNLLYAYLMTIVMGLHGLQIEKQAAEIRQNLGKITSGFEAFINTWDTMGRHLRNAQGQYDEGQTKLGKFKLQLEQVTNAEIMD